MDSIGYLISCLMVFVGAWAVWYGCGLREDGTRDAVIYTVLGSIIVVCGLASAFLVHRYPDYPEGSRIILEGSRDGR